MVTPTSLYTVNIYNLDYELIFSLSDFVYLEYHQRINAPWNHQLTLEFARDDPELAKFRQISADWIVEIYRTDPVTVQKTKVYEGLNLTLVDQLRVNGSVILNYYGTGYTDLLKRRVIIPPDGEEYSSKSGPAETIMKSFVDDSMVTPDDMDRKFQNVSVEGSLGRGKVTAYNARYIILLSVCEAIAEDGDIDFGFTWGGDIGNPVFKARPIWGEDKTEGTENQVVFSVENGNMIIPILSLNSSAEQNYAYVGGEGQGVDRVIIETSNPMAVAKSPWGRKEVWVDARQQDTTEALILFGQDELFKRRSQENFTFNVIQTSQSRWIRDWELGDIITANYQGYSFNKQIREIGVRVTGGQSAQEPEIITVELEDV